MTILTKHFKVGASQREIAQVVVEGSFIPIEGSMAGSTIRTKATIMLVILAMARVTVRGCALENVILMTRFTVYPGMFTFQFESRQIMVKRSFFPIFCCVAGITGRAIAQFMRVIRTVAGVTILRRVFKIDQTARIYMAQDTFHILMPTS
jgi:hypothetical protein